MSINKSFITSIEKNLYNINKKLIEDICKELNKTDKIDYLINKYLNKKKSKKNILNISNIKKNKSSYLFFTEEVRPKLRNKFPNDNMAQISKRLGKLWNNLTPKDKSKYEKKALIDKQRYLSEINTKVDHSLHSSSEELLAEEESSNNSHSPSNDASNDASSSELITEDSSNIITNYESDNS